MFLESLSADRFMALYATNGEECVFAADADPKASFHCLECRSPVKARRGAGRMPHFYHLQKSSRCHLYSKSEDHLLLQLQVQKLFLPDLIEIERPFLSIHRIADLIWEKEKTVFEIQCSRLDLLEAQKRIVDYRKAGYEVVWLLDDRIFNKALIRPAEEFLRSQSAYFFSFERTGFSHVYDQLEIVIGKKRRKKGRPLTVELSKPQSKPNLEWPPNLPSQIQERIANSKRYFRGDLLHRAVRSAIDPSTALALAKWRAEELALRSEGRTERLLSIFFKRYIAHPYLAGLEWLLNRTR